MSLTDRILSEIEARPSAQLPDLPPSVRAYLAARLVAAERRPILVAHSTQDAENLFTALTFLLGTTEDAAKEQGILFFGTDEKSPYEEYSPEPTAVMERLNTLYRLRYECEATRAIVVTPEALLRKHVPPSYLNQAGEYLAAGEDIDRDRLLKNLTVAGYNAVSVVEDPGTFSVRGGIIDVFSPYLELPVRVDFFGDTIDSLRTFDPTTQRSLETREDVVLLPAREIALKDNVVEAAAARIRDLAEQQLVPTRALNAAMEDLENGIHFFGIETFLPIFHGDMVSALEYLPETKKDVLLLSRPGALAEFFAEALTEAENERAVALSQHRIALDVERHFAEGHQVLRQLKERPQKIESPEIQLGKTPTTPVPFVETAEIRAEIIRRTQKEGEDLFEPLTSRLKRWREQGNVNFIVCHTRGQAERFRELMAARDIQVRVQKRPFSLHVLLEQNAGSTPSALRDPSVHAHVVMGDLPAGFSIAEDKIAFVSEEEVFGKRLKKRRKRRPEAGEFVSDLRDLAKGDYLVHVDFGIGLYQGLTRLPISGVEADYLLIEYKDGDKLYLPVHRLRLVQKYVSAKEGRTPKLSKLGTQSWAKTKRKVKDTLLKMAAELLRLYAARKSIDGFAFDPPDETYRQFEAEFEFDPTVDQQRAIQDVLTDLQAPSPADRLICGDVGYGKTEVAMRGAMLAVLAKKQVAILVPTTVLAAQHAHVFTARFKNFAVRVAIVSRFQSREEIKQALAGAEQGTVDILIGTHRLLSKDVRFKNLGLLVVDEEHRFGVSHKEKLKRFRTSVHVLSMSATPIPRTLHMGMMGARDMSMIKTAPESRLPVKTEVQRFSEEAIRGPLLKELQRGGQCFVVHNRVASIAAFRAFLEDLVPEARIIVGHGQMTESALEEVMVRFMNHEFNVLLSTTIIESGVDIPNANTIIVNRADAMGLAQLYQLRGRVGRSSRRGYCHFLIPAGTLTKQARQRIAVLQKFTELGAGFKVASHDLEIRGAGNILGKQQHGTVAQVGFEMYQALLKEAVEELRGRGDRALKEPEINLPIPALIPDDYVKDPGLRLSFYQRYNAAEEDEACYDLLQELTDVYGAAPAEVENLTQLMRLKQRLIRLGASHLDYGSKTKSAPPRIVLRFDTDTPLAPHDIVQFVQASPSTRKLNPEGKLILHLPEFDDSRQIYGDTRRLLSELCDLLGGNADPSLVSSG